jgi:glycosyltransferase involved in cell wall biosynthesis
MYKKISFIIPVFNEIKTVPQVIEKIKAADVLGLEKEIILIDDYSTDGTKEYLKNISEPNIKVFFQERNQGKGACLKLGFAQATGDIIIIQDADLEYDPADVSKIIDVFQKNPNVNVVYGSRYLTKSTDHKFWHTKFNQLFTVFSNLLTGQHLTDVMTCYKAFRRDVLDKIYPKLESKRFGFEPEVTLKIARLGIKITEVPISYNSRGKSEGKHMDLGGQIESLLILIKYWIKK